MSISSAVSSPAGSPIKRTPPESGGGGGGRVVANNAGSPGGIPSNPASQPSPKQRIKPSRTFVSLKGLLLCTLCGILLISGGTFSNHSQQKFSSVNHRYPQPTYKYKGSGANTTIPINYRDVTNYTGTGYTASLPKTTTRAMCHRFACSKDETSCDNTLPTNYDGKEPPCCTHILRDLARIFDDVMSNLGLEYAVAFGTLLGLSRSDRIIPWTADNDFIIKDSKTAHAMADLWGKTNATATTGLSLMFQDILRICITPQFAGGKIQKWIDQKQKNCRQWLWNCDIPYIDLYTGKNISNEMYKEIGNCRHHYSSVFPTKRRLVYDGAFALNFPANPEQLLRSYYGTNWTMPRSETKEPHGFGWKIGECPYGPSHGKNRTCPSQSAGNCTPGLIVEHNPISDGQLVKTQFIGGQAAHKKGSAHKKDAK